MKNRAAITQKSSDGQDTSSNGSTTQSANGTAQNETDSNSIAFSNNVDTTTAEYSAAAPGGSNSTASTDASNTSAPQSSPSTTSTTVASVASTSSTTTSQNSSEGTTAGSTASGTTSTSTSSGTTSTSTSSEATTSGTTAVNCTTDLTTPNNGSITYSAGTPANRPSGSTAQMACSAGFSITGTAQLTCNNGTWSPALGSCTELPCKDVVVQQIPYNISGQYLTITYTQGTSGNHPAGSKATFSCVQDSPRSGPAESTCSKGKWTGVFDWEYYRDTYGANYADVADEYFKDWRDRGMSSGKSGCSGCAAGQPQLVLCSAKNCTSGYSGPIGQCTTISYTSGPNAPYPDGTIASCYVSLYNRTYKATCKDGSWTQ